MPLCPRGEAVPRIENCELGTETRGLQTSGETSGLLDDALERWCTLLDEGNSKSVWRGYSQVTNVPGCRVTGAYIGRLSPGAVDSAGYLIKRPAESIESILEKDRHAE